MGNALRRRLHQQRFAGPAHEAVLNVLVAASVLQGWLDAVCARHGVTAGQYNVLRILRGAHPAGLPRCDVAGRMIDRAPDITRLIDRLVRAGLVRRAAPSGDRRRSVAGITPAGLRLLAGMQKDIDAITAEVGKRLGRHECETLSDLCERLYAPGDNEAA